MCFSATGAWDPFFCGPLNPAAGEGAMVLGKKLLAGADISWNKPRNPHAGEQIDLVMSGCGQHSRPGTFERIENNHGQSRSGPKRSDKKIQRKTLAGGARPRRSVSFSSLILSGRQTRSLP